MEECEDVIPVSAGRKGLLGTMFNCLRNGVSGPHGGILQNNETLTMMQMSKGRW